MFSHRWQQTSPYALPPQHKTPSRRAAEHRASRQPTVPVCTSSEVQTVLSAHHTGWALIHDPSRDLSILMATSMLSVGFDIDVVPRFHSTPTTAVSAAVALHDLEKASAAFSLEVCAPTGQGKTESAMFAAALLAANRSLGRTRAFVTPTPTSAAAASAAAHEAVHTAVSTGRATSARRRAFLLGRALGLSRSVSRRLRDVLLLLVDLRVGVLGVCRGLAEASGSRGRVFLRTPMVGSQNPSAPPQGPQSRTLTTAGFVVSPLYS
jgi:hypothetical protein